MRLKIVLRILVPALGMMALLAVFRPEKRTVAPEPVVEQRAATLQPNDSGTPTPDAPRLAPPSPDGAPPLLVTNLSTGGEDMVAVSARVEELGRLALADDPGSLAAILSALDDSDPQIREAALQASIQFGSREAIPKLMEEAASTEDPQARRAFEDAIEYLKLPSLTEIIEKRQPAASR